MHSGMAAAYLPANGFSATNSGAHEQPARMIVKHARACTVRNAERAAAKEGDDVYPWNSSPTFHGRVCGGADRACNQSPAIFRQRQNWPAWTNESPARVWPASERNFNAECTTALQIHHPAPRRFTQRPNGQLSYPVFYFSPWRPAFMAFSGSVGIGRRRWERGDSDAPDPNAKSRPGNHCGTIHRGSSPDRMVQACRSNTLLQIIKNGCVMLWGFVR